MTELMVTVAIIVAVLVVTVPSFTVIRRDLELSKARSDVSAALTAARSRALHDRTMVALHIFRDTGPVYTVPRDSNVSTLAAYNQSTGAANSFRWGVNFDATTGRPAYGLPHIPTNKMVMRLEVVNPDSLHNTSASVPTAVEFLWPGDHEPVVLPDSLGICRPMTPFGPATDAPPGQFVETEAGRVKFAEDFYIVFAEDGKLATVLVDYNLAYDLANPTTNVASAALVTDAGGPITPIGTWSASGFCLYDTTTYKAQPSTAAAYNYVNRTDNTVMISPYTGQPMAEATR
jgi:type II secretory pathway pseudopilin PulG